MPCPFYDLLMAAWYGRKREGEECMLSQKVHTERKHMEEKKHTDN